MKCWNCGQDTMSPWETLGKGWFKCSSCEATDVKMPELSFIPISVERVRKGEGWTKYKARPLLRRKKAKK